MTKSSQALCSSACDNYAVALQIMIKTFLYHNDWFDSDIFIICWGKLSVGSKQTLSGIYERLFFLEIDPNVYMVTQSAGPRQWDYAPSSRFSMFLQQQYGRVVYLDADTLVLGDLSELFDTRVDFGACRLRPGAGMELRKIGGFNAGMMTVGNRFLNRTTHDELLGIWNSQAWSGNQIVLNKFFAQSLTVFPQHFNLTTDLVNESNLSEARVLHFVGAVKPWQLRDEPAYNALPLKDVGVSRLAFDLWSYWANRL
jgi:lipopolysaccharide biosynthesis glycosyltransferase